MRYIKGMDIKETPVMAEVMDGNIELVDQQLRELGYKPYEEVVYEQARELNNICPSAEEIKQKFIENINVVIPEKGLPYMRGFSWELVFVDNEIRYKLVPNPNGLGTLNNPILFENYIKLFSNVYYFYQGKIYKYVGSRTDQALSWEDVSDDMEEVEQ